MTVFCQDCRRNFTKLQEKCKGLQPSFERLCREGSCPLRGASETPPYKCYRLLPDWLFRFIIIPNKYTPYTAIAAALTQADTFNPGVW